MKLPEAVAPAFLPVGAGVPLNDIAMAVLGRQMGKHESHVFPYRGEPLRSANTRAWRGALARAGITNFLRPRGVADGNSRYADAALPLPIY